MKILVKKVYLPQKKYTKGERVHTLIGEIYDKPARETIRIGYGRHIHDNYGIFINHSFNPRLVRYFNL